MWLSVPDGPAVTGRPRSRASTIHGWLSLSDIVLWRASSDLTVVFLKLPSSASRTFTFSLSDGPSWRASDAIRIVAKLLAMSP